MLAIDLGTSAVKAVVWNRSAGVIARGTAPVATSHPQPGYDEQDADDWWHAAQSVLTALPLDGITGVGLSSQRETFVCLDAHMRPLRPALLWSDDRAPSPAKRWEWLQEHEPDVAAATRWLAAPKDYVLHQMVGRLVTDTTLAARTDLDTSLLPDVVDPRIVVGEFRGLPVVAGAGDRACEVYAVGATSARAMVSWGTTANCSLPLDDEAPAGWRSSRTVDNRPLAEAGMSAAGSALGWLSTVTATAPIQLARLAADAPPGANGVIALPWLGGARAPWWRPDAKATLVGVTSSTTPGDLARAVYEGVAHDVRRALAQLSTAPETLLLAGGGATDLCWQQVLSGITALPLEVYGSDAAAIGAAGLVGHMLDNPLMTNSAVVRPAQEHVAAYQDLAANHDAAAKTVLGLSA
jgi:xylulokinase